MTPTQEEELKLRLYNGDLNQLGTAERFLKNLVEIPFAFKRLEALLFMSSLHENYHVAKESFTTLEVACNKLTSSRLFLRLLEAVLKTGNRMNDGTYRGGAQAFKLDTLLKLSDVKGTDGKTTLLSFVVQEIIRYEGIKVAKRRGIDPNNESPEYLKSLGMEVVSKLSEELVDVKKASIIDGEMLTSTVSKLGNMLKNTNEFMNEDMTKAEGATEFNNALYRFLEYAEADINWMIEEEKRIMAVVKSTADYFHGKSGKDEGLRLFAIVRDFLKILDHTCNEVRMTLAMKTRLNHKESSSTAGKSNKRFWKNTRDKIMIMKDAVKMILDALYDDDEADQTQIVQETSSPTPEQGEHEHTSSPYMPNIHDKLALLANNLQINDLDSDSDDWSSDDDETKRDRKQSLLVANENKMDHADEKSLDDEEKKPLAFGKTTDDNNELMNSSDADCLNLDGDDSCNELLLSVVEDEKMIDLDDDVKMQSNKEEQHTQELIIFEERIQRLSDADDELQIPMFKETNDSSPDSSISEERSQRLSNGDDKVVIPILKEEPVSDSDADVWGSDDDVTEGQNGVQHKLDEEELGQGLKELAIVAIEDEFTNGSS